MTTVIYHRSDYDGIFCREIARKALVHTLQDKDVTFIGMEYGDPEPTISQDATLYILDFSWPSLMSHPKLVWIDHHASAIKAYDRPDLPGIRLDGVAACRLTWQWFFHHPPCRDKNEYVNRHVREPLAVRLAGEYDIWDKRDPRAEAFQFGLRTAELTDESWVNILSDGFFTVDGLVTIGEKVQRYAQKQDESIVKNAGFLLEWEGLRFHTLNTARGSSNTFRGSLVECDALMIFGWTGKHWRVSLYHAPGREDLDLSQVALRYGGGGHRGACGFTSPTLPFELKPT